MKKIKHLVLVGMSIFWTIVSAQDIDPQIFTNDKEAQIMSFSSKTKNKILKKYPSEFREQLGEIYLVGLNEFLNSTKRQCSMLLYRKLVENLQMNGVELTEDKMEDYLILLRASNKMDDILYEHLDFDNKMKEKFYKVLGKNKKEPYRKMRARISSRYGQEYGWISTEDNSLVKQNNLEKIFGNKSLQATNICFIEELKTAIQSVKYDQKPSDRDYEALLKEAYYQQFIDLDTYYIAEIVLEELLDEDLPKIDFAKYLDISINAKNKMRPKNFEEELINIEDESTFNSSRIKRFSSLTRRKLLYQKFNPRQIIMLTNVIKRASTRMGVDPDVNVNKVSIQYFYETVGERENYVEEIILDPQSQFNLARRLMRKDILDLYTMDTFRGVEITYEDMVTAALETGYITFEDVQYVVKYDDLWNVNRTPWQKFKDFAFSIGGTASLFLPPPWNIVGTIGLVVAESTVNKQNKDGANHVNPAAIID